MNWNPPSSWAVAILAAGKGKRMDSPLPKVLHEASGSPLLAHVLSVVRSLRPPKIFVIVGFGRDKVLESLPEDDVVWVDQTEQLGTGDAVSRIAPHLGRWSGELLVLYGDVPLLRHTTLADLMETHLVQGNSATILTADYPDPTGYGRILRDEEGHMTEIREHVDLRPGEEDVREINSGIGVFQAPEIFQALSELRTDNAQGEYYLTDVVSWFKERGRSVGTLRLEDPVEISGVNTPQELAGVGRVLTSRKRSDPGACRLCVGAPGDDLVLRETNLVTLRLHPEPYNSGYLVVAPKRHLIWYSSLTEEERLDLMQAAGLGERALRRAYAFHGVNMGYTSGRRGCLGHLGLEIIPRWGGDSNFMQIVGQTNLIPEAPAQTRQRILEALQMEEA
jgi:bifunctional UDP-N-acetylglucosamine pyrophosphorylase/glucosamine-1-phosphate N-acetyltransferase